MSSLEILVGRQNVSGSAIKSIKQIAQLNQVELFFDFLPLLRRLNQAVTNEARSAFPALIPVLYTLVQPAHKEELRNGFRFSCLDQSLMVKKLMISAIRDTLFLIYKIHRFSVQVRRAAVAQLAAFGKLIDQARLLEYIEPIIDGSDEDMKPPIVEACVSLIKYMPRQQKGQMVVRCLPYFRDRNMQLALVMARSLGVLSKATGRELRARLFDVARGVSDDVNIDLSVRNAMKASLKRLGELPN